MWIPFTPESLADKFSALLGTQREFTSTTCRSIHGKIAANDSRGALAIDAFHRDEHISPTSDRTRLDLAQRIVLKQCHVMAQ
jgi:hypothetical protein